MIRLPETDLEQMKPDDIRDCKIPHEQDDIIEFERQVKHGVAK